MVNNDSFESIGNYDQLLPAVKTQPKFNRKRSPSKSNSPNRNQDFDNGSTGRVEKKLKPTLDQGLHFVHTSVNVPVKQTNFYDNKHGSAITEQQMKQWKIKNGEVMLDTFNKKRNVPPNRHRIPAVGAVQMQEAPKKKPVNSDKFGWDLDGRMHKKSNMKQNPQFISSN